METNKVSLEAGLSVDKLIEQVQNLKGEIISARDELNNVLKKTTSSNDEAVKQLGNVLGRVEAQKKEIIKLNEELEKTRKGNAAAFDDTNIKKYQEQIKKLESELQNIKKDGNEGFEKLNDSLKEGESLTGKMTEKIKSLVTGLLKGAVATAVVGTLIKVVTELKEAIFGLSETEKLRKQSAEDLNKISIQSQQAARAEKVELQALVTVAKDKNRTDTEREAAVKKINDLMPDYIGYITLEEIETGKANVAIEKYIKNIEAKARAQGFITAIQTRVNKLIELESLLVQAQNESYGDFIDRVTGISAVIKSAVLESLTNQIKQVKEDIENFTNLFEQDILSGNSQLDLDIDKQIIEEERKIQEDRKNARLNRVRIAKEQREEDKKNAEAARKYEAARLKALAEEEARLKRIADLEKQLAILRLQLTEEGKQRDILSENSRFQTAINSLELLKKQRKTSADEIVIIDQLIEAQKQLHVNNLLKIDQKYLTESQELFIKANDKLQDIILTGQDKEVADLENKYIELINIINKAREKAIAITDNPLTISGINKEADDLILKATELQNKERLAITQKYNIKQLDEQEALAKSFADIIQVNGLTLQQLDRVREVARLNITIEFAKKRLAILEAANEKDILAINKLKKAIEDASRGIENISGEKGLFESLGIDEESEEKILNIAAAFSAFNQIASDFLQPLIDGIDLQIQKRQELIDKIQEEIQAQESLVEREKELAEEGYANNLSIEQAKLDDLKKNNEEQIAQQRKLAKEKAALQKEQIITDSFAQTSNLITASSEIFKVFSKIGPLGVPLAIAAIAAMFSAFIGSKINAIKAVNQEAQSFKKGGYFDVLDNAPSHEEGGAGLYNEKTGEKLAEFEGKEKLFIVNKDSSKKYAPLLEAINKDQLSNWSIDKFKGLIKPQQTSFKPAEVNSIALLTNEQDNKTTIQQAITNKQYLKRIAESNEKMLLDEKNKEIITDLPDKTIIKKGNVTRIIKK